MVPPRRGSLGKCGRAHTAKQLHSEARRQQCGFAAMRHAGTPRPINRHAEGVQQRSHHSEISPFDYLRFQSSSRMLIASLS